jgi:hypothetical protein
MMPPDPVPKYCFYITFGKHLTRALASVGAQRLDIALVHIREPFVAPRNVAGTGGRRFFAQCNLR